MRRKRRVRTTAAEAVGDVGAGELQIADKIRGAAGGTHPDTTMPGTSQCGSRHREGIRPCGGDGGMPGEHPG